tara:strand:- start:1294 stop:1509 length:216 start_codon:yes stop_codon:yes gene_type:complete
MMRTPVKSSNLSSVGYDGESQILEVEFTDASVYQYFDVPSRLFDGLMGAVSHGKFFDANIKKGGFRYRKIS